MVFNLVVPITSNKEVFIQTAVQEPDHWTISVWLLEVFPPALPFVPSGSQSTNRASCFTLHIPQHIQPAPPSLPCCSLAFIREFWLGALAIAHVRTGATPEKGSAELWGVRQPLASPQTLTLLWSQRQEGPAAIPVLEYDQESLFSLFQH